MDMKRSAWQVDLGVFAALIIFFLLAYVLGQSVTPFIIAALFSYVLNPAVDYLVKRGVSRGIVVAAFVTLFFVFMIGAAAGIVYIVQLEIGELVANLPRYLDTIDNNYLPAIRQRFGIGDELKLAEIAERLKQRLVHISPESAQTAAGYVVTFVSGTVNFFLAMVNLFLIPVLMAYMMMDFNSMKDSALDFLPRPYKEHIVRKLKEVEKVLRSFARGQLMVALAMGVMYCVGLTVAGVDMPVLVGMSAGILNLAPYLGTVSGGVISLVLVLLKYQDLMHPALVLVVFSVVQGVEGYILTPRVMGRSLGLHPVAIFLALMVFGHLLGFVGILLAVPIAAVLKVFMSGFLKDYKASKVYGNEEG